MAVKITKWNPNGTRTHTCWLDKHTSTTRMRIREPPLYQKPSARMQIPWCRRLSAVGSIPFLWGRGSPLLLSGIRRKARGRDRDGDTIGTERVIYWRKPRLLFIFSHRQIHGPNPTKRRYSKILTSLYANSESDGDFLSNPRLPDRTNSVAILFAYARGIGEICTEEDCSRGIEAELKDHHRYLYQ